MILYPLLIYFWIMNPNNLQLKSSFKVQFYSVCFDESKKDEFDLNDLGERQYRGDGFVDYSPKGISLGLQSIYSETTQEDYDNEFYFKFIDVEPADRGFDFLDYHFYFFKKTINQNDEIFLNHLQYVILPKLRKSIKKEFGNIMSKWLKKKTMDFKRQLEERDEFLRKAYEEAYSYDSSSPLFVSINPIELGNLIGLNSIEVEGIVLELVNEDLVESTLGMQDLFVTQKGLNYLRKLEKTKTNPNSMNVTVGNNSNIQIQQGTINSSQNIMKQTEKLDLILRRLYDFKDNPMHSSIDRICKELKIPLAVNEWSRLAHQLEDNGFVNTMFWENDCSLKLTADGIDYCEHDSYTYKGNALIENNYNISIVNSPGTNFVNQSQNVSINSASEEINEILKLIHEIVIKDNTIQSEKRAEIIECLSEINESLKNTQKPKFAIKSLISIAAGIASIANYLTKLSELFGIIPIP